MCIAVSNGRGTSYTNTLSHDTHYDVLLLLLLVAVLEQSTIDIRDAMRTMLQRTVYGAALHRRYPVKKA